MLNIDESSIRDTVAQKVADDLVNDEHLLAEVSKKVQARIDNLFAERVDVLITKAIDDAVVNAFEREYTKVDQWGQKVGQTTSVKNQLDKIIGDFWSARVSSTSGQPTERSYDSVSRAEFIMLKVCAADFSKTMQEHAINIAGHLKDGLRNQMAAHMDNILSDLFRVKSLQDQGKVVKPY